MQLISNMMHQEAAMGAAMVGYFLYYYETWILPTLLRQEKSRFTWNAAWEKYHENIYKFNYAYDRDLRYSAISKNMLLDHIHHTKPKSLADHVSKMISTNKKVYDAFHPDSKRVLIWQVQPALQ
jgi:hypothetical protein